MRLVDHEAFKQIQAEVDEVNRLEEQQRKADQLEAQRLRQEKAQLLNREYTAKVEEYEALAGQVHQKLGEVWRVAQEYSRLTGVMPPAFMEDAFMGVNVPSILPKTSPYDMGSPYSTTRISVMGWFSTMGKSW
jgi:hypothetical protein